VRLIDEMDADEMYSYYFFYDQPNKKYFDSIKKMQKMIYKEPEKYYKRILIKVNKCIYLEDRRKRSQVSEYIRLALDIKIYKINKDGKFYGKKTNDIRGNTIFWELEDFQVSRFTKKIQNKLVELSVERKLLTGMLGSSLRNVVCVGLKREKIDISEWCTPYTL
jgi:hypothetical protein